MVPNAITAPVVISSTGHDGPVGVLSAKWLVTTCLVKEPRGVRCLDTVRVYPSIDNGTKGAVPGLIMGDECCGALPPTLVLREYP